MSRLKPWAWLLGLLAAGGVLSPPFWSGVRGATLLIAAVVVLTAARELARLAVGCAMGMRPAIVELGEAMPLARFRTGRLLWVIHRRPIGSATLWEPPAPGTPVRARLVVLTLARPAVAIAVLLAAHAAAVPLGWSSEGGGPVWRALVMAAEGLAVVGLVPFTIRGQSIVPFESDGMKLANLLLGRGDPAAAFGHSYYAMAREALNDGEPARAVSLCREGQARASGPWSEVLPGMEALARGRMGDYTAAMAQREAALARELQPMARAAALNDWSWYAFLERDDRKRRLADRRSAQAMVLKPDLGPVAGTRGAILLWQGRVAEALPLLERAAETAQTLRERELDFCLVAIATAGRGDVSRARQLLARVTRPAELEGLFEQARRAIDALAPGVLRLAAERGRRALAVTEHGVELHDAHGVRQVPAGDIRRVDVGLTARGRAHVLIVTDRNAWRLPLAPAELTWARLLLSRVAAAELRPEPTVTAAEGTESLETQERAYQERARAMTGAVSTPHGVLFLASMVAFAASMLWWSSSWQWVGMLLPILFVHELGHWVAMRAFGHADAKIAFIPLMGAATMTRIPFQKRWQEIVMLLAGPLPGIVAGIVLLVLPATRHMPRVHMLAIAAVSINFLNLLPLHPLDGGRILHALVTAGRPRLDLALKTAAEVLFLWGGIRMHDPVLMTLGLVGLLFWPHARRVSQLEGRIRATPGFDPRLPAKERRAYIFRALAHEPALKGKDWASTVTTLEGPLGYQLLAGWKIAVGGVVTALVVAGGVTAASLWFVKRFPRPPECPASTTALPVSCAGPSAPAIDWRVPAKEAATSPDEDEPRLEGFVWCATAEKTAADKLLADLNRMQVGREFCAAYPWEIPGGITADQQRARETLARLFSARYIKDESRWNRALEQRRSAPGFDEKTAQLIWQVYQSKSTSSGPAYDALSERLGRAPGGRCDTVAVRNVRRPDGLRSSNDVAFSVSMNEPADFAPLQAFLCQAGCRLSVLPAAPDDRRVDFCR